MPIMPGRSEEEHARVIRLAQEFCERKGPELRSAINRLPRTMRADPLAGAAAAFEIAQDAKRLTNFSVLLASEDCTLQEIADAVGLESRQSVHYYVQQALRDPFLTQAAEHTPPELDMPGL